MHLHALVLAYQAFESAVGADGLFSAGAQRKKHYSGKYQAYKSFHFVLLLIK